MMLLGAGLYVGPFLAGLARHPAGTILVFGALLALWSILYQGGAWPRRASELASPAVLARTLLLACAMLVIAGIFFLAGTGLSFVAGVLPLPTAVPLAIPVLALALAVLVQSPRKAAEMDAFLDDALRQLKAMQMPATGPNQTALAEALATQIRSLPDDAGPEEVSAVLAGSDDLDAALLAAVDRMGIPPPRPARLAAVLLVTDVERGAALAGRAEAAWVFDIARGDPDLEALFATRALALLAGRPDMRRDMPYSYDVDQARQAANRPEAAKLLEDLRDRLNALSAEEESDDEEARRTA